MSKKGCPFYIASCYINMDCFFTNPKSPFLNSDKPESKDIQSEITTVQMFKTVAEYLTGILRIIIIITS